MATLLRFAQPKSARIAPRPARRGGGATAAGARSSCGRHGLTRTFCDGHAFRSC